MAMEIRRPLKRALPTRLGPPDIYPQDPKQKEDELTSVNVKQGYTCAPLVSGPQPLDEFGSAKNANIEAFGVFFSALLSEKHRMNTLKDTQKKKQLVNTKEIWYVHAKTKHAVDNWFRDLANGIKSLGQLGKRIPIFNSKEGMFGQLYESHVPLAKAVWFIKMSAVHAIALSESSSKSKKRQVPDQYQELTTALTKYLKELSVKIFECYQQSQQMQLILQQQQQQTQQPNQQQPPPHMMQQQSSSHPSTLLQQQQGFFNTSTNNTTANSTPNPTSTATANSTNSILQHKSNQQQQSTLFPKCTPLTGTQPNHFHPQLQHNNSNNINNINSVAGTSSYTSSLLNHQPNFTANLHTSVANLMTSHTASAASLSATSISSLQIMHEDFIPAFNQWQYQTQLARYLFDEGLLDQYDFLCFLLELIEKKRPVNDLVVKIICPLILEYVVDFSKSAVLSRRLAHVCAKKLSQSQHNQNAIYILSSILQVISIECPTAMVRHHIVDSKFPSMFQGSPLDHLPCLPSSLPMLESDLNFELRKSIYDAEREILHRSAMADSKWSCDSSSKGENSKGGLVSRLLLVMDILDKHNFDKIDSINTIDILYPKIFPSSPTTTTTASSSISSSTQPAATATTASSTNSASSTVNNSNSASQDEGKTSNGGASDTIKTNDEHVIKLLCEWATTTQRTGEHRALVVARILEKHQAELQTILVQFLDENAPVNQETSDEKKAFNNLVLLFSELIRCDVFSHYNYMCALISRGMFNDLSKSSLTDNNGPSSNKGPLGFGSASNQHKSSAQNTMDSGKEHGTGGSGGGGGGASGSGGGGVSGMLDIDDVDADLGKILQDIKEGQQDEAADILLPDYLASTTPDNHHQPMNESIGISSIMDNNERKIVEEKEVNSTSNAINSNNNTASGGGGGSSSGSNSKKNPSEQRHMTFVKHFPLPDDENYMHDNNQRNFLLYGFGKEREENRHVIKKLIKEICKLFHRKVSIDINDASKINKKMASREGFNPEHTLHKFEALNHYDQHLITNNLSMTIIEMFTGVSNGQTFLLPTLDSLSFVFDLFTMASNVSGLLELVTSILEELSDIEAQIKLKCPILTHQYTYSIALCIIGMLYRYHSCVLLSPKEDLLLIFGSLHNLVSHIPNPGTCSSSAERVIFCYLNDLYSAQTGRIFDKYSGFIQKTKQTLQNVPAMSYNNIGNLEQEWNPPYHIDHTNIVNQLRAYQMNDMSGSKSSFVCDAIFFSATAPNPDIVNEIAVTCADATSKYPALIGEWLNAFLALCCSHMELGYKQLPSNINISDPQVMNNIAIFTAILVARRCLLLEKFIIDCALKSIFAPIGTIDRQISEPGARLTCQLLLTLFRNRESPMNQSRYNLSSSSGFNAFTVQTFPNYGNSTPNYGGLLGNAFTSMGMGIHPPNRDSDGNSKSTLCLKYLCDHHLLRSACCNIKTEFLITLLKSIRFLISQTNDLDSQAGRVRSENHFDDITMDGSGLMNRDLDTRDGPAGDLNSDASFNLNHINLQTANLHHFADAILRLLCSQRWLHDKCLSDSELFTTIDTEKNILIDPRLGVKQSQRLLYMICYNKSPEKQADVGLDDQGSDQVASIVKMFENLDLWSMRLSLARLQFMFAYCKSQSNVMLNDWLDNLAKAVVEFFQKASQESDSQEKEGDESNDSIKPSRGNKSNKSSTPVYTNNSVANLNKVWLIEPLLDKLSEPSSTIQSKIIKASAALMESASVRANSLPSLNQTYLSTAAASTKFKERTLSQRGSASTNPSNLASTSLLGFQPFLSLLLTCIKNQDKERDTLLTSLNSQLYQAIHEKVDDIGYKQSLQDGLELRLCLIGQMFDTIQKSANLTSDWATLLLLLIMNSLVDPQVNYNLYVSVLDMLAMLIHTAYASDPIEQKEEAKKQYQNLMKKFRKELAALEEKGFIQMKHINPLMPLVRQMTEVITCEPMGSLVDTKGEKVENFYSIDKKKGLKVSELQEVSPWDLIEGHKNPAPLSWPWFGAIRLEQKPLRADENNRLMSWHTHTIHHTTSYFYQKPNLDDGPAAKRSNSEKKPSQSNPLLKSLIEANDESSLLNKSKDSTDSGSISSSNNNTKDDEMNGSKLGEDNYIGRDDLLEDYCELPIDLLFDATPIETMIEDIKTAMQAEHAAVMSSRAKLIDTKPPVTQNASSILAPIQPQSVPVNEQPPPLHRSTTPQISALSALQNHLNTSTNSVESAPGSVPPPSIAMSPIVNPHTPEYMPTRPPSNIPKIAPTPPPMVAGRSMSPMVARSPVVAPTPTPPPPPKPKATRKKRTTKKDALMDANANIASMNKNAPTINMIPSTVTTYTNNIDPINQMPLQPPPPQQMVVNHAAKIAPGAQPMHQLHQQQSSQGMIVRRTLQAPQPSQQQLHQQQQQQAQASVYDFQYQPQPPPPQQQTVQPPPPPQQQQQQQQQQPQQSNQFVQGGQINSYYEQQAPNNNIFTQSQQQQQQQPAQMHMNMQTQHHPQQHQLPPQQTQQQQQHMQQHHHPLQYQQTPPPPQSGLHTQLSQQAQQQQQQQQQHPHMQHQQIRLAGHQHQHQQQQQQMSFQQIQQQQQHVPHPQQQIFAPQQAAGHSRPALTAMLHQKHAAAGNPQTRFPNF